MLFTLDILILIDSKFGQKLSNMGLKILVAEDNKFTAMQYQKILENNGHTVIITNDGNECVKKYADALSNSEFDSIDSHPFDLVLLDHNMPKKSGAKAAKEILSKKPNQKILFASGYLRSLIEDQTGEKLLGKLDIIEKPFSLNMLLRKIDSMSRKK